MAQRIRHTEKHGGSLLYSARAEISIERLRTVLPTHTGICQRHIKVSRRDAIAAASLEKKKNRPGQSKPCVEWKVTLWGLEKCMPHLDGFRLE